MPIVNGTYVNDTLFPGDSSTRNQSGWIEQAFGPGKFSSKDWSDTKTAAYNYLLKQQEQAYNLELWNLQNEYNSPAAQMKRYQDAGLNPNLIYGQSNEASAPASASASPFRSGGTHARRMQNAINTIGAFRQIVEQAWEAYQYFSPYGRNMRSFDQMSAGLNLRRSQAEADWYDYITYGARSDLDQKGLPQVAGGYRAGMYNLEANSKEAAYERAKLMAGMIPDQQARTQALKALDDKRLSILQGQNDAILNIHTGNETVDAWLKALMYFAMSKL